MPRHRWQWSQEKAGRIYGSRSEIWTTDLQVVRTTELEEYYCDPPLFVAGLPCSPSQAQTRFTTSAPPTSAQDQNTFLAQTTHIKQICFQSRDTRKVPNILKGWQRDQNKSRQVTTLQILVSPPICPLTRVRWHPSTSKLIQSNPAKRDHQPSRKPMEAEVEGNPSVKGSALVKVNFRDWQLENLGAGSRRRGRRRGGRCRAKDVRRCL